MSREKQIEEMATKMMIEVNRVGNEISFKNLATALYNAGYRKASDLAEEIFAEIWSNADLLYDGYRDIVVITEKDFAELKKKYTQEK
jgi:hypothetical protein